MNIPQPLISTFIDLWHFRVNISIIFSDRVNTPRTSDANMRQWTWPTFHWFRYINSVYDKKSQRGRSQNSSSINPFINSINHSATAMLDCGKGLDNRLVKQWRWLGTFIARSATHIFGYEIIQYGAIGILYVTPSYSAWIFCKRV